MLEQETKLLAHAQTLLKQRHLLSIAALEKSDAIWKSYEYMFDIKKGTMKRTPALIHFQRKLTLTSYNGGKRPQTCASYA